MSHVSRRNSEAFCTSAISSRLLLTHLFSTHCLLDTIFFFWITFFLDTHTHTHTKTHQQRGLLKQCNRITFFLNLPRNSFEIRHIAERGAYHHIPKYEYVHMNELCHVCEASRSSRISRESVSRYATLPNEASSTTYQNMYQYIWRRHVTHEASHFFFFRISRESVSRYTAALQMSKGGVILVITKGFSWFLMFFPWTRTILEPWLLGSADGGCRGDEGDAFSVWPWYCSSTLHSRWHGAFECVNMAHLNVWTWLIWMCEHGSFECVNMAHLNEWLDAWTESWHTCEFVMSHKNEAPSPQQANIPQPDRVVGIPL